MTYHHDAPRAVKVAPASEIDSSLTVGRMPRMFHVSSAHNRKSIQTHGLDWSRMSAAPGIAGSRRPEVEGVFLSPDHFTAQFFVRMNNTGGPVDIWAVDDVDPADLIESGSGFSYLPHRIHAHQLTLHDQNLTESDLPPAVQVHSGNSSGGGYSSHLTHHQGRRHRAHRRRNP